MPTYDLQDPTDLAIMKNDFDTYSHEDWDEYIEWAEEANLGYKSVNALKSAQKKAGMSKFLSPKMINWILNIVEKLDAKKEENNEE